MKKSKDGPSLSHSARSALYKCHRLYKYGYIEGVIPKNISKPLRMGSAYSDGLEHWSTDAVDDYYAQWILDATHANEVDWLTEELVVVRALIDTYMQRAEQGEREVEFRFPNGDNGFIDGRLDSRTLVENKCKAQFTVHDVDALRMDGQCTGYIAAQNELEGVPVEEITLYYDVAKKPMLRQKKTENHSEFITRLETVIYSDPDKYHQRHVVTRSQRQVDEYRESIAAASKLVAHLEEEGVYARNSTACTLYGKCSFFEVCYASPEERADILSNNYKEKEKR